MARGTSNDHLGAGAFCSLLLHAVAVLLAIFGLPELLSPPPEEPDVMVVDVETIADKTAPPPRQIEAPKPEETPPEPPKQQEAPPPAPEPPKPIPPEPPKPIPPEPPKPQPTPPPEPEPVPIPVPKPKPEPPKEQPKPPPPDLLKDIKPPPKKPPPPDDFDSLLKSVDKMRQAEKSPPSPDKAPPSAQKTVNSPLSDLAAQPTASEKSYIAGQIWPRWNVDLGAKGADTLQVTVKIRVSPAGEVLQAFLDVDQARYNSDSFYRAAADAAKRAVYAASPLKAPSTRPDLFRNNPDMTINFDPRSMAR